MKEANNLHTKNPEELFAKFKTSKDGLTSQEAEERLKQYGSNVIRKTGRSKPLKIFIEQFTSPLIIILVFSAIILGVVTSISKESNVVDIFLILFIVILSGLSGFFQEYKAERSIEELQKMAVPKTRVIRDGKIQLIASDLVVPGDLLTLSAGDIIPADAVVLNSSNAQIDESILTGESDSVDKNNGDSIYMDTNLILGKITAIVSNTGMQTKLGDIAGKLETIVEEKSPFYIEINNLSKKLFGIIVGIAIITAIAGLFRYSLHDSILSAVALAVAAIPEGLPAVLVLSLAVGSTIMIKKKALVRKLGVIESMGSVNVICTDKTGTLTKNNMEVVKIFTDKIYDIKNFNKTNSKELLLCNALNNNVEEIFDKELKLVGDETEVALFNFAKGLGYDKKELDKTFKRIYDFSFSSQRKMMSVVVEFDSTKKVYSKGAPEVLIEKCDRIFVNGKIRKITKEDRKNILEVNKNFAKDALRVLGFAYKEIKTNETSEKFVEKNLIWIGLEGLMDPPREGVKQAIAECKTAGIRVMMLTGDNPFTAKAISAKINIPSSEILTGTQIDLLNDSELNKKINSGINIFARLTPTHKLRIMSLLKSQGNIVAMTGDGVNDALALKKADVGVAMGLRGTEVAKKASDLVLMDDNFVTIVSSIKEGRRVFDNIRKFVNYLLTSNLAEVLVIFLATLFITLKNPILLPVQLLWINLLTDGFPALALGVDPARPRIMQEKPRKKSEHIINRQLSWLIALVGIKKTIILFITFFVTLYLYGSLVARTTLFTGFVFYEFVRVGAIRSQEKLTWCSNKLLLASLSISVMLQILIIYTPINSLFKIVPLGVGPWIVLISGIVIGYFLAITIANLVTKYIPN